MGVRTKFILFTNAGVPETGLTPTVALWALANGDPPAASSPAITEVAGGVYTFEVPSGLTDDDIALVVDGGNTLPDAERYKLFQLAKRDYLDGVQVDWTPPQFVPVIGQEDAEDPHPLFVTFQLNDRNGVPLESVGSISAIQVLAYQGESNQPVPFTIEPEDATLEASANDAGMPGLYRLSFDYGLLGDFPHHWDRLTIDLQLAGDAAFYHRTIVTFLPSLGQEGEGSDSFDPTAFIYANALLGGLNGVFTFSTFNAKGDPETGKLTLYTDAAGAEAQDEAKFICELNLIYTYDGQGQLTDLSRTIDAENMVLFQQFVAQFASEGGGGGG